MGDSPYEALTVDTLGRRLAGIEALGARIGPDGSTWRVREVGDGNLNLVFIVEGEKGAAVVKQALPYVRLVGDSWPLPLKRAFFEYHALIRQAARDPGSVPEIYYFDEAQALIVMEYLRPHIILRQALIKGHKLPDLVNTLGLFTARTLFRGSDLSMKTADRKADLGLFSDNAALCDITENLVFTDPYFDAAMNKHTSPELDDIVARLRADRYVKVAAQELKHLFTAKAETLVHGDLHSGSVMVTETEVKVIDPEFAFYGPFGFDVGMLLSNFWMAYFAQSGQEKTPGERAARREEILEIIKGIWDVFVAEFSRLWHIERNGILYRRELFEDAGDRLGSEQALASVLRQTWVDALGFAGIEMHRRILGLAHNADFESIADTGMRAGCERKALELGWHLMVNRATILTIDAINDLARMLEEGRS
jgi:5-methylthioribose kinase